MSVRIAEQIAARIESGELPVGTKLPAETELARQFGVSRPSVREALGALQFVGYIDSVRGSGTRVVSQSRNADDSGLIPTATEDRDILLLFEARFVIEPYVMALAARDPDMEKLDEADALIEGMALVVSDPTLHGDTDLRVHRALAEVCQNHVLRGFLLQLLDVVASPRLRAIRKQAWTDPALPRIWGSHHREIAHAIRERDAVTAAGTTRSHLASSAQNTLSVIAQNPGADVEAINSFREMLGEEPFRSGHDGR